MRVRTQSLKNEGNKKPPEKLLETGSGMGFLYNKPLS